MIDPPDETRRKGAADVPDHEYVDPSLLGGEDEQPHPGRAYFYDEDALSWDEWHERYRSNE